jgi:uncharacterized delta-60 repeat protein
VRYNTDGSLDPTFGVGGKVTSDFGDNQANAVILQPDQKIVTAGGVILARYIGNSNTFNYDPNGQFESLATDEVATDTFSYVVSDSVLTDTATVSITVTGVNDPPVAVDDSGPGFTTDEDTPFVTRSVTANDQDVDGDLLSVSSFDASGTTGLVTYNGGSGGRPGSPDVDNFGAPNGYVTTDFGGFDSINDVVLLPGSKILAGGFASNGANYDFALARYNSDGSLDTTFGNAGSVLTDFGGNDYGQ